MDAKLKEYADLMVRVGLNVQPGQSVNIFSPVDCAVLTRACVQSCYEAGAREVTVMWNDDVVSRLKYLHADDAVFDEMPAWLKAFYDSALEKKCPHLAIVVPGKLAGTWYALLLKGIMCNFLVCMGVYAGLKLKSESGKCIAIIVVITTFVLCGFEHSVANMATFSLYALLVPGADFGGIAWNMIWVTLGNIIGGAVLLGLPVWMSAEPEQKES